MKYQLMLPYDYRRNISKKAIEVIKDHFISVLSGIDKNYPLRLWCQSLIHTEN